MNRVIKFRAWDKNNKGFINGFNMIGYSTGQGAPKKKLRIFTDEWNEEDIELMQFTGLHDTNEKEIYEGDVVSFSVFDYNGLDTQYKGVVKWANAMFEIWHDAESEYFGSDGAFVLAWVHAQDDEIEVIGNIYENAEVPNEA
jgi:uncharacterized phage protein (TIGR01671 family)